MVHIPDGRSIGFEVQYIWDTHELIRTTSQNFYDNRLRRPQSQSIEITFVFVVPDQGLARQVVDRIPSGSPFHFVVGVVGAKGQEPLEIVYEEAFS
jgi:hypothetical protein